MLQAYMDDSGSHEDAHACVIAGYFGGVNRWGEFERQWKRTLDKQNIGEFHAREFWKRAPNGQGVGEYRGWSKQRLDEFLDSLLHIIEGTALYPFASGVLRSEWRLLTVRERKILAGGYPPNLENASTNPIFLPFQRCISRVVTYCKPGLRVHFVLDDNKETKAWAGVCYDRLKDLARAEGLSNVERSLGNLTFSDSKLASPLQAADLLAYEANRHSTEAKGNKTHPVRPIYRRALSRLRSFDDFWLFDRPRLQQMIPFRSLDEKQI